MNLFYKRAIVELLETFSKAEVKEFRGYLQYKEGKTLVDLWTILHKKHPKYNISDEKVFELMRPNKTYNDGLFRMWIAELTRAAKDFISIQAFQENDFLVNNTLSMALLKRRVVKMGRKTLANQEKMLESTKQPDMHYFTHCFLHKDIAYQYMTVLNYLNTSDNLQEAVDYLDYSYLMQKLKYLFAMHNRKRIVNENYTFRLETQLLDYLDQYPQEDNPLIHLYYLMLRLIRDLSDHASFDRYLAYYKRYKKEIHPIEARQLTTGAINFCYWNIQLGHLKFLMPRLELAKIMIGEQFVLVDGRMPGYHFRNIVRIGIEAAALSWVEAFIKESLPLTLEEERPYLEAYNWAYLYFAKGEFKTQTPWMRKMEQGDFSFIDLNNEIAFRILKLKTAFEQLGSKAKPREHEAFQSQLDAFRNFLTRKSAMPENARRSATNFQKALHQLHQLKQRKTLRIGDLKSYILDLQPIQELPWVLGKII